MALTTRVGIVLMLTALVSSGCGLMREPSKTPRTAIEQLLLSHAVQRSMEHLTVPLPDGATVAVEATGLSADRLLFRSDSGSASSTSSSTSSLGIGSAALVGGVMYGHAPDLLFARDVLAGRLGELGFEVRQSPDAAYRVRLIVEALGTDQGQTFFGMPPVQSVVIPFSLPALTVYEAQRQVAHMRFHLQIFEVSTGRLFRSTPWYMGSAYYNQYTVFFFIVFKSTDLPFAPSP